MLTILESADHHQAVKLKINCFVISEYEQVEVLL